MFERKFQCDECIHSDVCSKKDNFLSAQYAVDDVTVGIGDNAIIHLHDMKWIEPVQLKCIHFYHRPTVRGGNV